MSQACPVCKAVYTNVGHPLREGVVMERLCKCTHTTYPMFTLDEVEKACKNIGFDLSCGRCAGILFTGSAAEEHDVGCTTSTHPVVDTAALHNAREALRMTIGAQQETPPLFEMGREFGCLNSSHL